MCVTARGRACSDGSKPACPTSEDVAARRLTAGLLRATASNAEPVRRLDDAIEEGRRGRGGMGHGKKRGKKRGMRHGKKRGMGHGKKHSCARSELLCADGMKPVFITRPPTSILAPSTLAPSTPAPSTPAPATPAPVTSAPTTPAPALVVVDSSP